MSSQKGHIVAIVLSFFAIYIIWGSTYLFVAYAVEEIPPLKLAAVRFFIAGGIMLLLVPVLRLWKKITKEEILNAMKGGFMFLTLGNGAMCYALLYIDSGFAALLISAQPLIIIVFMRILDKIEIKPKALFGAALGIVGMYLLVSQDALVGGKDQWKGLIAIISCLFTWGYASMFVQRVEMPKSIFVNSSIQMLFSSATLFIASYLFGESSVDWMSLKQISLFSLMYLVIFGSIMAFTAFNYLLRYVAADKVATSTYINPIVAMFLGWYFRNELITPKSLIAASILLLGVYFINTNKPKKIKDAA
jgi:drug/metabolite transporter (DMT)-like permease